MERASGWIAGGLFMSFSLALLAFVSMSGSADTPVATPSTVPAESPAVAAARAWLALVAKSDWNASWEATGQSCQAPNTAANWSGVAQQLQRPLGPVRTRVLPRGDIVPDRPIGLLMRISPHRNE